MLDFLMIATRIPKKGTVEIYPKFVIRTSSDLMIRGGDFYAIWNEDTKLWSTEEEVALYLIDRELDAYRDAHKSDYIDEHVKVLHMWDAESGMIDKWHKFVQKQMRDGYHPLDETVIFSNTATTKKDYASKKLKYPFEDTEIGAYNELISTLYTPTERQKIEWAIGAVISGESKYLQKFLVMYGAAGTGKSTILNIIQDLFDGYYSVFDAKALGSANNAFALEAFRSNPLVAIQHDGDLSKIEDNTRLNSLVSHEMMIVNEKFKSNYASRFNSFLFMGTNKPVRITDAKSGIIRRLIDVSPTGEKLPPDKYKSLTSKIKFELGGIACHCLEVYKENPGAYDNYIPVAMLGASNDFYNFVIDSYDIFKREDGVTLKQAWEMYKSYCEDAKVSYPYSQRLFKEELKNYFKEFKERAQIDEDLRVRNYFSGFITDKFEYEPVIKPEKQSPGFSLDYSESIFDDEFADCFAQYANSNETPNEKWANVKTKLSDISTSMLHYVKVPENLVVVDFDIKDESGNKSYELNSKAASRWPPTYSELSKGGGIHLHYYYSGDVSKLSRVYASDIEIKVFTGNMSLRRKLTRCNNLPIATINSGLPLKEETKMINFEGVKNEKAIRTSIKKNLNKEVHPGTKPSVDFIFKILEDAYSSGIKYDISDLRPNILAFAAASTNHSDYCIKVVNKMKFKSEEPSEDVPKYDSDKLIFFDVEVFKNLFIIVWKAAKKSPVKMINPTPSDVESLLKFKLVGFNCRRYDNHILYARLMGYTNEQLYVQSQRLINNSANAYFGEAYNISYTDIYDFASSAHKQSLKKFEIEMGIHHQELGLKWDEPVPEELWDTVADYCVNDVVATEATFDYLSADWIARKVLAKIAGGIVNDTTNTLTTKLIFGSNKHPQDEFVYTDLSTIFPGYKFENGVSTYCDEVTGEGGYVYAEPGMYGNVALLDIASMHPRSVIALNLFGDRYTARFKELVDSRIAVKHKDREALKTIFNGAFAEYADSSDEELNNLASALKTAINSVYGLTSAKFDNSFKDKRNIDNIVAKRGALFMINLKHEVQKKGFVVAHIKTDSIKIPDATPEIIQFVIDYGKQYGYTFEHEDTYDKFCLVNDAVYIARYKEAHKDKKTGELIWWTATGAQFQQPYVFKKLFSKQPIQFADMCETKSVKTALYLDMNESLPDVSEEEKEYDKLFKLINDPKRLNENMDAECTRLEELGKRIAANHNYHFVGKAGQFTPIKPGCGGGVLLRENEGKYYAATGTKGYRWLESEMVKTLEKEADVDETYYICLVNDAIAAINTHGDFEWFASDDPYDYPPFVGGKRTKTSQ